MRLYEGNTTTRGRSSEEKNPTFIPNGQTGENIMTNSYLKTKQGWTTDLSFWNEQILMGTEIADPAGEWDYSTAQEYVDTKVEAQNQLIANLETSLNDCARIGQDDGSAAVADFSPLTDTLWNKAQVLTTEQKDIVAQNLDNKPSGNGMGRVVLKADDDFKTVIEGQTEGNVIFVIRYDFTLSGNVTVPENCILEFDGGSISGAYTVTFQNTIIKGSPKILSPFTGTITNNILYSSWFGITNNSTQDNYIQTQCMLNSSSGKKAIFESVDNGYFKFTQPLVVYPGTHLDGENNKFIFDFSTLMQDSVYRIGVGFMVSSNCTVENIEGFCFYSGTAQYQYSQVPAFINIGIFDGISVASRVTEYYYVPGIESTTPWDAPENIIIHNIKSDISNELSYDSHYNQATVFMTNYVKNITINNISAIGFAEFIDIATSHTTTGKGICNDYNIMNVVRFEWGNQGNGIAAGSNIRVSNIYGKALCLHDHSAVVSMGNAFNFVVENVIGESTGQIIYCGPSIPESATLTKEVTTVNRLIRNVVGHDLYIYTYKPLEIICGAIAIEGNYEYNKFNTSTIIENVFLKGNSIALNGFRLGYYNYASSHLANVIIKNAIIDNFERGFNIDIAENIKIENCEIKNTKYNGIFINTSNSSFMPSNLVIKETKFINCCTEKRGAGYYDSFLFANGVNDLLVSRCYFKQTLSESMLGTYFMDNNNDRVCKRIMLKDCIFETPSGNDHIAYSSSVNNNKSIRIINCVKPNSDPAQIGNSWLNPYVSSIWDVN